MSPDPRLITAFALCVMGLCVTGLSIRLWWTHPVNRALFLGPFITPDGMRWLTSHGNLLFSLGLALFAGGFSRAVYWARRQNLVNDDVANFFGLIECIFAVWAAGLVFLAGRRMARARRR